MPPRSSPLSGAGEPDAWRAVLGELIAPASADPAATGRPEPTRMALQFAPRVHVPRTTPRALFHTQQAGSGAGGSGAGSAGAGPGRRPGAQARLGVRPVVLSATGNWVKSTVTWGNVAYQLNRLGLDPEQHRWFSQFPALHRDGAPVYRGEGDWLDLDEFASPLLWHLLDDAARIGIELVGSTKGTTVEVGGAAEVSLDVTRAEDGEVRLAAMVSIDGRRQPADSAGALGGHGLYTVTPGDGSSTAAATPPGGRGVTITLAPTAVPLTGEQRTLLARGADAIIPGADVPDFLAGYYPALRQRIRVVSSDASVEFPKIPPPTLVLTAGFRAKHRLLLDWWWEYTHGDTRTRAPLHSAPGDFPGRDRSAEEGQLARVAAPLRSAGLLDGDGGLAASSELQGMAAADFTEHTLPALEGIEGVRVERTGTQPDYRELTGTPRLTVTTVETDERDWFDLGVIVTVDGRQVPFGPLFTALAKGRKRLLLIDGSHLSLNRPVFDRLRELIDEARTLDEWETGLRISRTQTSLWADFEDLADEAEPATAWRELVRGLDPASGVTEMAVPAGIAATLRPYQVDGFRWLAFLWEHRLGGILADDMGLGKTLQTLALLVHAAERTAPADRRPFLVVAPASVVPNWVRETERFAPALTVAGISATQAKHATPIGDTIAGADVVVTSYALFRLDFEAYRGVEWAGLILDEAQFVKNRASAVHGCARDLPAPFKLAVTGTPMENDLMELWSLFAITAPGLFPSARRFAEEYQRPIEGVSGVRAVPGIRSHRPERSASPDPDGASSARLAKLRRRIRPLMLRRTKGDVAGDLPAKQEQVLEIELTPAHRELYDTFLQRERQKLLGLMDDLDRNRFIVFRSLTLLRLLSLDPALVDPQYAGLGSAKLDALLEQLDDVIAEGHRALIFSQFTSFLGTVASRLTERGIDHAYLDGSTRRRGEVIDSFTTGDAPVFLISLKAGGFGLNLTEADYVFLLDPWWNPAAEEQAVDRTHRIGQTRNVMVYRMVSSGTIEEKVMALKARKARLFDAVLDDDQAFSSSLTADDLRALLG